MDCNKWIEFNNRDWKLNVPVIIAQRKVRIEIGRGLLCDSKNDTALLHWQNWYQQHKIYEKLVKMSWTKSLVGVSIMFIYETKAKELNVMLGTALMMNFVSKINEEEQSADIWIMPNQDDTGYIFHIVITNDVIKIDSYPNDENTLAGSTQGKIDDSLRIESRTYINKLGVFPLIQIPNFIRVNPTGQASSTMLNAYPDIYPTMWLIEDLQDNLFIKKKTRKFSRARGYAQLTTDEFNDIKSGKRKIEDLESDYIIQTAQNNYDQKGGDTAVQYTQGEFPSEPHNQDSDWILRICCKGIGISWDAKDGQTYTNQNQTLIMQAEDIESQAVWQEFLLNYMYRLFDAWWIYHGYMSKDLITERPYSLRFKSAGIIDTMRMVDINNIRLENGTMSRAKFIHEIDGIPMNLARKELEEIDKEYFSYQERQNELDTAIDNKDNTGGIKNDIKE